MLDGIFYELKYVFPRTVFQLIKEKYTYELKYSQKLYELDNFFYELKYMFSIYDNEATLKADKTNRRI